MVQPVRIAASVRLIIAMFRLFAGIEEGFGKALISILKKSYPDQEITDSPSSIGGRLMSIARKQLQYNDTDAMDAVQDLLTYLSVGSKYETNDTGKVQYDDEGEPLPRTQSKPWNFRKDFDNWKDALNAIYSNLRTTSISKSKVKTRRKKTEKSIDQAYGVRGEEGGAPEGGEARMPTPEENSLGTGLDTHAAIREFINLVDEHVPDLRGSLTPDALKLFDLIFSDNIGSFGSDIKENMGQATALKDKYPELYEKNAKRWSGFVGDLRKNLLSQIWNYLEDEMSSRDFQRLSESFFGDVDPSYVRKIEKKKVQDKVDYQRGIDLRKVVKLTDKIDPSDKDKISLKNLTTKLQRDLGKDFESMLAKERAKIGKPGAVSEPELEGETQISAADMNW